MAEEKSSRSEAWKDKFKDAYIDTVRQIDKLNKKATLARQGMEEANKGGELVSIDPTTKEMVGYEMLGEPQRDIPAEAAAARLREVSEVHYRDRAAH